MHAPGVAREDIRVDVDVSRAEAKVADGVLVLTLPKTTGTPAHRLPIN